VTNASERPLEGILRKQVSPPSSASDLGESHPAVSDSVASLPAAGSWEWTVSGRQWLTSNPELVVTTHCSRVDTRRLQERVGQPEGGDEDPEVHQTID
jgi:hypothetical protein